MFCRKLRFHLRQEAIQLLLAADDPHRVPVDQDLILAQLAALLVQLGVKVVLEGGRGRQIGFQRQGKLVVHLAVHLILVAQQGTARMFHVGHRVLYHALVRHHAKLLSVHGDGEAGGIQGCQSQSRAQRAGNGQKGNRTGHCAFRGQGMYMMGGPAQMNAGPLLKLLHFILKVCEIGHGHASWVPHERLQKGTEWLQNGYKAYHTHFCPSRQVLLSELFLNVARVRSSMAFSPAISPG